MQQCEVYQLHVRLSSCLSLAAHRTTPAAPGEFISSYSSDGYRDRERERERERENEIVNVG